MRKLVNSCTVFGILISLNSIALSASPLRRDNAGNINSPAIELEDGQGHKIFLTGMVHLGTSDYFSRTEQAIKIWVGSDTSDVVALREFFTCNTRTLDSRGPIAQSAVDNLKTSALPNEPGDFLSSDGKYYPAIA